MLYMFLAEGFEETEAIGSLDVIRRAGIDVKTVGVTGKNVCGSHGIEIKADITKDEVSFCDMTGVILPGGIPGTPNLQKDDLVQKAIAHCNENGLLMAAICAAPMIYGELGILNGKNAVCYPGFEEHLKGAVVKPDLCVTDGNVITGKGAGASMMFGAEIVNYFKSGEGDKILVQMMHK